MIIALKAIAIIVLAPLLGGLLMGFDRQLSARMQRRKGPPLLQPFYDVGKLFQKQSSVVDSTTSIYVMLSLIFMVVAVVIFFLGLDLLLVIFAMMLSAVFLVLAGYSGNSPYAVVGAQRELLQVMAYEPMVILAAIALYYLDGDFRTDSCLSNPFPAVMYLPLVLIGFVFISTFKLRKSPFDLSTSHHGHQELVKGLTTEMSGSTLALMELMHWYETILVLGFVFIFFAYDNPLSWVLGVVGCLVVYLLEIFIDNTVARVKWEMALKSAWIVTIVTVGVNMAVLTLFYKQ